MNINNLFNDRMRSANVKLGGIARSLSVSLINQVISSGSNFALGIYLVRILSPIEFGLYGIGFAIVLFYSGIGNALFLTQMVVHVPEKPPEKRLPYAASMFVALLTFCAFTALFTIIVLSIGNKIWLPMKGYSDSYTSVLAASIAYLLKDFFVRHAYTARKEILALGVNAAIAVSLVALFFYHHQAKTSIDAVVVFNIFALSNSAGVIIGLFLIRLPLLLISTKEITSDWKEAWHGGIWALGGAIVIWSQSQAYVYVTAFFAGPSAVGMANAARLLITPAIFLLTATNQILLPRLATLRHTNINKMFRASEYVAAGFVLFAIFYTMLLLYFRDQIINIVVGNNYKNITTLTLTWCLVLIFQFSRTGTSVVLQVLKEFRRIMIDNLWSAIVGIVSTILLLRPLGVQGAILGTAIGELILSVMLYRAVLVHKSKTI